VATRELLSKVSVVELDVKDEACVHRPRCHLIPAGVEREGSLENPGSEVLRAGRLDWGEIDLAVHAIDSPLLDRPDDGERQAAAPMRDHPGRADNR
jgi:hypothetical protein